MKPYKIEGTATVAFSRVVNVEDLDDAWNIADELMVEDLEDEDFIWPPTDMIIDDVWKDE